MLTCIDVKFIFDNVRLGSSSSANILQIAEPFSRQDVLKYTTFVWYSQSYGTN